MRDCDSIREPSVWKFVLPGTPVRRNLCILPLLTQPPLPPTTSDVSSTVSSSRASRHARPHRARGETKPLSGQALHAWQWPAVQIGHRANCQHNEMSLKRNQALNIKGNCTVHVDATLMPPGVLDTTTEKVSRRRLKCVRDLNSLNPVSQHPSLHSNRCSSGLEHACVVKGIFESLDFHFEVT